MLMARSFTSFLLLTGQHSTHSAQPVQSSGATWRAYFLSLRSFQRAGTALKVGARRPVTAHRRAWRAARCADRPIRTYRTGYKALRPRPGSREPCCASPTARWRWGRRHPRERANGQIVAIAGDNLRRYLPDKVGRRGGDRRADIELRRERARNWNLMQKTEGRVHRREILAHHAFAALPVGLLDSMLDGSDGVFAREHAADREKAGLHDGVDALAHTGLAGHFITIDNVERELLVHDLLLNGAREVVPNLVRAITGAEQEGCTGFGSLERINALEEKRTGGKRRNWLW